MLVVISSCTSLGKAGSRIFEGRRPRLAARGVTEIRPGSYGPAGTGNNDRAAGHYAQSPSFRPEIVVRITSARNRRGCGRRSRHGEFHRRRLPTDLGAYQLGHTRRFVRGLCSSAETFLVNYDANVFAKGRFLLVARCRRSPMPRSSKLPPGAESQRRWIRSRFRRPANTSSSATCAAILDDTR